MPRFLPPALVLALCAAVVPAASVPAQEEAPIATNTQNPGAEKYTLRYRFQPGEIVKSRVVQQTKIETTIAGTTQTAEMTSVSTKSWRVTDVDSQGRTTFETMVENIDLKQKMSGRQEVRYNSQTDKKPPPGYESAAESVGVILTEIQIDPAGKLLKREKRAQSNLDNANALVVVPLPADPVAVGASWSVPIEVPISLEGRPARPIAIKQRYELEKIEDGIALIRVEPVLPPLNDPKVRAQLIQRLARGAIRFDLARGHVLSQQTDLDEQVIGFNGADSSLHYLGRFIEELIPPESQPAPPPAAQSTPNSPAKSASKSKSPAVRAQRK